MTKRTIKMILTATLLAFGLWFATSGHALAHEGVGGDEYAAADIMLIVAMASFLTAALAVIWSIRNGELQNPEGMKYRMLDLALTDDDGDDISRYAETDPDA